MLRIIQNSQATGAKSYYSTSDYYTQGQELEGVWRGEAAKRLGLTDRIRKEDWDALCDNRDPCTGQVLTQRQKANRRIGYDFNFHVPKSVSVLYGLTQDERILTAFRESVGETMRDIELEMKTRVRRDGKDEDRTTGNMVWGEFIHTTARPVDGIPDPHLHAHCFVFNTTWDGNENRWKAGQFADLKREACYFEALFHARYARRMAELGLPIERVRKGWEIDGIPQTAIQKFSRRTALIEQKARELGVTDPEAKSELGAKTRERKQKNLSLSELRQQWEQRMSPEELTAVREAAYKMGGEAIPEEGNAREQAVDLAIGHCFERSAVVPERKVLAEGLKRAVGKASAESVLAEFKNRSLVTGNRDGRRFVTTREVLEEEQRMLDFARKGRGTCPRLGDASYAIKRDWLNGGQRRAVQHVLNSPDRVLLVRGAAGVGKTAMMKETVEAIEAYGKSVFVFAPSADASRGVLKDVEGFANADTVARLLIDERLQTAVEGQVIWVDEAGLLGSRAMARLFDLAARRDARVILSGDRRQHGSVERGAALRLLEEEAGLISAEIKEIQRQKGEYKQAVQALSDGRTSVGFRQLDTLGWIHEVNDLDRYKMLAADYVASIEQGKSTLVVSPTHLEGEAITDEIRDKLKQSGRLKDGERQFKILENANLTEAERADATAYTTGDVMVFHQNARGYAKGQRIVADGSNPLPLSEAAHFQVFHPNTLPVAPGDALRITRNGATKDGKHRLNNGALFKVKGFSRSGDIILDNDWVVSKDYGHLAHGYCVTSHASQGKTVQCVLIGQSSASFPASTREQFYVSVSRGKEKAIVYTDDKNALLEAVQHSDERLSATELINERNRRIQADLVRRLDHFPLHTNTQELDHRSKLSYER